MKNKFNALQIIKDIDASTLEGEITATFKNGVAEITVQKCTVKELILLAVALNLRLINALAEVDAPAEHIKAIFDALPVAAAEAGVSKLLDDMINEA